jgi:hypothetical protein
MSDATLLWLCAGLTISVVAVLAALATWRQHKRARSLARSISSAPPCGGPIVRLDFAQSLDPALFADAAEEEALAYARLHLNDLVSNGTTISLQLVRLWAGSHELTVAPSSAGRAAMHIGKAAIRQHHSGRLLPLLTDQKTGQVVEVMKEVGHGRKAITVAATASAIVVSAAHMIATADLARSLKLVDGKVDLLLAFRRIDQLAALERIYSAAKELLSAPLDELRRLEMWRLRGELRELRGRWRRELGHRLLQIEHPAEQPWLTRMLTTQSGHDGRISGQISAGQAQLAMVEYSLRLDQVLAAAGGTRDVSRATLGDELVALDRVGELLRDKAALISEERRETAQPMIDGIGTIVEHYRALTARPQTSSTEESAAAPLNISASLTTTVGTSSTQAFASTTLPTSRMGRLRLPSKPRTRS